MPQDWEAIAGGGVGANEWPNQRSNGWFRFAVGFGFYLIGTSTGNKDETKQRKTTDPWGKPLYA